MDVSVTDEGILIRRVRTIGELFGILHDRIPPDGPLSWEEERRLMEEAVARQVADE